LREIDCGRWGLRPENRPPLPPEFSGGQRQRVGIAARDNQSKIVICDEPVRRGRLDPRPDHQYAVELKEGRCGTLPTSDPPRFGVSEHMSDRVAVMYLGPHCEQGHWREDFTKSPTPTRQTLIAGRFPIPLRRAPLEDDRGELPQPLNPRGMRVQPALPLPRKPCAVRAPPARRWKRAPDGPSRSAAARADEMKVRLSWPRAEAETAAREE